MTHVVLTIFMTGLALYTLIGAGFSISFALKGTTSIDRAAAQAPLRVRLIFIPGAIALWPLLLPRAIRGHPRAGEQPPGPIHPLITRHKLIWITLAPVLTLILIALILLSPDPSVTP